MSKQTITAGAFLILVILSTSAYITLNDQVRIRVDSDKTTFYVPHEEYSWIWSVTGREYNRLLDGTSLMNRDRSSIRVNSTVEGFNVKIVRETTYLRGPVIRDTYTFRGDVKDVFLFPINHKVEVFNASGYFYRYTVDELEGTGDRRKLYESEGLLHPFDNNMKVQLSPGYRWAWVGLYYGGDSITAQYSIPTDYEVFNVRLFDPPPIRILNCEENNFTVGVTNEEIVDSTEDREVDSWQCNPTGPFLNTTTGRNYTINNCFTWRRTEQFPIKVLANVTTRELRTECTESGNAYVNGDNVTPEDSYCTLVNSNTFVCDSNLDGDGNGECQREGGETCTVQKYTTENTTITRYNSRKPLIP